MAAVPRKRVYTEEQKKRKNEMTKKWRAEHPPTEEQKAQKAHRRRELRQESVPGAEKRKQKDVEYASAYHARHRDEVLERRREKWAINADENHAKQREYVKKNRPKVLRALKKNYQDHADARRQYARQKHWSDIVGARKRMALRRGIEWKLSDEEAKWFLIQPCHYCGSQPSPYAGIDRIDSGGCYDFGNIVECCGRCNLAKGISSYEEFQEYLDRLVEFRVRQKMQRKDRMIEDDHTI